jgi:outer membrane protein OmpA-like peptidoglycan-associated protein
MKKRIIAVAIASSMLVTGCMENDPNKRAKIGAGIGAVTGAIIGNNVGGGGGRNRFAGAVIGALAGGAVGHYMDEQARELRRALESELAAEYATVERLDMDTIKVSLSSEASFSLDSASLKSTMKPALNRVASVMARYNKTVVYVIGHTDSSGSDSYNQDLSERRASSVSGYLSGRGVSRNRLYAEGRGETQPRASNSTQQGRKLNRRVELFINAVVAGNESNASQSPY